MLLLLELIIALPNKVSSKETVNVRKPSKSHLSDLLTCPSTSTSSAPKRPSTRARLLTSDECLRMLEEKEKKKEMETQEKEKRKNERAAKKKEREELLQKKKEEKAKKAEERAKKQKKKPERLAHQENKRKAPHLSQALQHLLRYVMKPQQHDQLVILTWIEAVMKV